MSNFECLALLMDLIALAAFFQIGRQGSTTTMSFMSYTDLSLNCFYRQPLKFSNIAEISEVDTGRNRP